MKEEASKQNGNEKHIYHRILSWCGEHKMKLFVMSIIVAIISICGLTWHMSEGCSDIAIDLEWVGIYDSMFIETEHGKIPNILENEPVKVQIKISTLKGGKLKAIAEKQEGSKVQISETRDGPWKDNLTIISIANLEKPLAMTELSMWIKGEKHPQEFDSGIYVKATLNGCEATDRLYFSVYALETSSPPTTTSSDTCLGTALISILVFLGVLASWNRRRS